MASKTKIDKVLKKVKKVKADVDFIQSTNLTVLHEIVDLLQSNPAGDLVAEVAPIKACMEDPQVRRSLTLMGDPLRIPSTLTTFLVRAVHLHLQWTVLHPPGGRLLLLLHHLLRTRHKLQQPPHQRKCPGWGHLSIIMLEVKSELSNYKHEVSLLLHGGFF